MTTEPSDDEDTNERGDSAQNDEAGGGLSYEQARDELVSVVQRLENGGVSLQESVALWERGEALAAICQRWLDGARQRLDAAMDNESR